MGRPNELAGCSFGAWRVESFAYVRGGARYWNCLCTCGIRRIVVGGALVHGKSASCGCKNSRNLKHGEAVGGEKSPELKAFFNMRQRCLNHNHSDYRLWGGRGILIHQRWLDKRDGFKNFLADVGRMPGPGYSLDRFPDRNGNYAPGNVRWATAKQQGNNTRRNHFVSYKGETLTVTQLLEKFWSEESVRLAMSVTFYRRLGKGWSVEEAIETPRVGRGRVEVRPNFVEVQHGL